ncbi:MAG TPA: primosomal protein N' [bacterium]|nr:primosomal protein N' [bacterium]
MSELYAEVAFPIALKQVFTYRLPPPLASQAAPGMRCFASFGRRQTVGFITRVTSKAPDGVKNLKSIDSLLDPAPVLTPDLLELGAWMADYYYCSLGETLFTFLPPGGRKKPKSVVELTPEGLAQVAKVETLLGEAGPLRGVNWERLRKGKVALTPRTQALAESLKSAGLGVIRVLEGEGKEEAGEKVPMGRRTEALRLHPQQQRALAAVTQAIELGTFRTFLLQGVTGSGKTEVYLQAIARVRELGQQAIVLIPEIALTPQTVERFTGRFGDRVAILHSRLDPKERNRQWERIAEGGADVVVGARSALFAPVRKLGLVVVDEEHEQSYKQEDAPRYHARDAAVKRAQIGGALALLGSATPSLESLKNAREGKYGYLEMPERVNQRPLPRVKVLDLRQEWQVRGDDRPVLSMALEEALRDNLDRGEQAILFLNRRGFNTATLCLKCGEPVHCPNCSVPVTSHRGRGGIELWCHYCDWRGPVPKQCVACKDGVIKQVGLGTERLEEELKQKFPKARIERMDLDTTQEKGSHEAILGRFRRHEVDVLLGTQMIAKGHDFPGVTLVGIVGADTGLSLPDFRAQERVFQLLVQVSGRAGRAEKEGVIYLQTFQPENPSIQAAARHDMNGFWEKELDLRQALGYPPYTRLGLLVYRSEDERKAQKAAEEAVEFLSRDAQGSGVEVRGPAPSGIFKVRGHYRYQVLLKAASAARIRGLLARLDAKHPVPPKVFRVVDIDPQSML